MTDVHEEIEQIEEQIEISDLDVLYSKKEGIHEIMKELYKNIKNKDFTDPFRIVLRAMETVEKLSSMPGVEKKKLVIQLVQMVNKDVGLIPPKNLDSIIDTIIFASKNKNKLTKTNLKKVLTFFKNILTLSCFEA